MLEKAAGITLVEVLVSLVILSLALLGLAKYQIIALKQIHSAFLTSIAITQINSMRERLYADPAYVSQEVHLWNKTNQALLPLAKGQVFGHDPYQIKLRWQDPFTHKITQLTTNVRV